MDYYSILGVDRQASPDEIKSAYRKKAMNYHPDRGGDEQKFKEINEAYDVLSDPQKKSRYDMGGQTQYRSYTGNPFEHMDPFGMGAGNTMDEMFKQFGFHFRSEHMRPKNKDLHIRCRISLKDSYLGKVMNMTYKMPSGKNENLEFVIPPGVENGQSLKVSGYGDDSISSITRGDLNLTIDIEKDRAFWREDLNLCTNLEIDIFEAMTGCVKTVKNIDDTELDITIRPGAQHGIKYSCKGVGFKSTKFNHRGDLIVVVSIKTPVVRDPVLVNMINQLAEKIYKNNP